MEKLLPKKRQGFTLIEVLVVIGILATLFAIVLVAINPARQFAQANNTKRQSDVQAILNAVHQYAADNRGTLPTGIGTAAAEIGNGTGQVDICAAVVSRYIAALPSDPSINNGAAVTDCEATYNTGYQISQSVADQRITVTSMHPELGVTITVTR